MQYISSKHFKAANNALQIVLLISS